MNLPQTMEGIANTEAIVLASLKVVLPVKPKLLGELLDATRRGALKLSPKVWRPKTLIAYCDHLSKALEHPIIGEAEATGIHMSAWTAFAQMAAILMETDNRQMLAWVARSCENISKQVTTQAPLTAETLARVAEDLREHLGVKDCACDTCVAVAAVQRYQAMLDAEGGHSAEEWLVLVDALSNAASELIASIKTPPPVGVPATLVQEMQTQAGYHVRELN